MKGGEEGRGGEGGRLFGGEGDLVGGGLDFWGVRLESVGNQEEWIYESCRDVVEEICAIWAGAAAFDVGGAGGVALVDV